MQIFNRISLILIFYFFSGCVERYINIKSDPPNAKVYLDGKYIGKTPLKTPFNFYGSRQIALEKKGFYRINTIEKIKAPIYQTFPLDFAIEFLYPFTVEHNHFVFYHLKPFYPINKEEKDKIKKRAIHYKDKSLDILNNYNK